MIPDRMHAIVTTPGLLGPDTLRVDHTIPAPKAKTGEVVIAVRAAGVNRPDLLQREGKYPPPPGASEILGLEVAGVIAQIGESVTRWKTGDTVCALLPGGGYAQYASVDAGSVLPLPDGCDFLQAAALPETVFTVWANVFERGGLQSHETLLIHGANSGIGVAAIQMAKAHGAKVIATVRGADKAQAARNLGADLAIDTAAGDFTEAVKAFGGADVCLDMLGGDYVARNLACLNTDGRLVQIAFLTGSKVEVDLRAIMLKRLTLTGSTLRARPALEKARLARAIEQTVWPWVAAGLVKPVIDAVYPLDQAAQAHAHLEAGGHVGKVMLSLV